MGSKIERTPLDATFDELVQMRCDNIDLPDYWCSTDGYSVTITKQRSGEAPTERVKVPVKDMRRIVKFLTTPQTLTEDKDG